jgi:SAM-dependent methyltransferase
MTIANTAQAEAWNSGEDVAHWVRNQARYDRMNEPFATLILDAAALGPGGHVLDVGCGCGGTTLAAAGLIAPGQAVGIDLSGPMLARARADAEAAGLGNVAFQQGDAQVHPLGPAGFDTVTSRFGVMFFADPVAAFTDIRSDDARRSRRRHGGPCARGRTHCARAAHRRGWRASRRSGLARPGRDPLIVVQSGRLPDTVRS